MARVYGSDPSGQCCRLISINSFSENSGKMTSPSTSLSRRVRSIDVATDKPCLKISAPPIRKTFSSCSQSFNASVIEGAYSAPVGVQSLLRLRTICRLPGRRPGRDSKVFRPIIIGNPMVVFLNKRSSSGMCHGILPFLPITRFLAIATMIIISIISNFGRITEKDIVFASASI